MTQTTTTLNLALLRDALLSLDISEPDPQQCSQIESVVADLLKNGSLEGVKQVVLEAQNAWESLPEEPMYRKGVRFIPQINPLARFVESKDTVFLLSISKNYFGFTAAGLALDVPEKLFGKREGYLRSVSLSAALDAHQGKFALFKCESPREVGAYLRLLNDDNINGFTSWDFLRRGEADFTFYKAWGHADKVNLYSARTGFLVSCGFDESWLSGKQEAIPSDNYSREMRKQLRGMLGSKQYSGSLINAYSEIYRRSTGGYIGITSSFDRLIDVLSEKNSKDSSKLKLEIGKAALGLIMGSEGGATFKRETIDWLGIVVMEKWYGAETLEYLYHETESSILLKYVKDKGTRERHFITDLGL